MKKYLIIGNGIAGTTAAEHIRKHDAEGHIALITKELFPLYSRIRLPDYLCGKIDEKDLIIKSQEWHDKHKVQLITGVEVEKINYKDKKVFSKNSESFEFDSLLIAVGSNSFIPPVKGSDKKGVITLRTIDDAKALIKMASGTKEMVVIGGGVLGLEAAAALIDIGIKVTVVEIFDRLLPRQLDNEGAKLLQGLLEKAGFNFRLGDEIEEILGKEPEEGVKLKQLFKELKLTPVVESVRLKSGDILKADAVLFSTGVHPDLSLLKNTSRVRPDLSLIFGPAAASAGPVDAQKETLYIKIDKGIVVNERMETSVPSIYAAGDIVQYQGVNFCIWPEAMEQGRVAGINMAGGSVVYKNIPPSNMLKVAGIALASAGEIDVDGKMEADIVSNSTVYRKIVKDKNGKIVGCIMIGDTAEFNKILQQIKGA
ncbi:MAG: NAD(P)/FAD-dependent oxidoreductase [Desulfamplus sp.]|nr:NAD(P)/FAD-dependent oxidoreductase [Desulfamplus sp.]